MVDSARFRCVNKKLTNGVRSTAENGDGPPNQCKGSDENRSHAHRRAESASLVTALACRIQLYFGKPVKWRRFLVLGTFPIGTVCRSPETTRRSVGQLTENRGCLPV